MGNCNSLNITKKQKLCPWNIGFLNICTCISYPNDSTRYTQPPLEQI